MSAFPDRAERLAADPRPSREPWRCPNCGREVVGMAPLEHALLCCATERVKGIRLTNRLSEILQFLAEHRSMMVDEALGEMVARELL